MTGSIRGFRLFEISAVILAALSAVFFMGYASQWGFKAMTTFLLWVLSPYGVYLLFSAYLYDRHFSPALPICACITSVLILAFTLWIYISALFIHVHSTSGLVFLSAPFLLLIGGPAALCACLLLRALLNSHK